MRSHADEYEDVIEYLEDGRQSAYEYSKGLSMYEPDHWEYWKEREGLSEPKADAPVEAISRANKASGADKASDAEEVESAGNARGGDIKPIGMGVFGNIYDQFRGKAKEALAFLKRNKQGDLLGVFHRDEIGDVDLVWGDEKAGLSHINSKHVGTGKSFISLDSAVEHIDNIIKTGAITFINGDKVVIKKGDELVTLRKNVRENGKKIADKNWILTAYDEKAADDTSAISVVNKGQAAPTTAFSEGKDNKNKEIGKGGASSGVAERKAWDATREEVDHNGHPFVISPDGTTIFGEITDDTGLPSAPIKLSEGIVDGKGNGYGLQHIEARHGEQIRNAGFKSVVDFVKYVAENYDKDNIKVGKKRVNGSGTFIIQIEDEHSNLLYIELSRDGSYWNVNSGGVFRKEYSEKRKNVEPNTELSTSDTALSDKSFVQTNSVGGSKSADTHSDNQRFSDGKDTTKEPAFNGLGGENGKGGVEKPGAVIEYVDNVPKELKWNDVQKYKDSDYRWTTVQLQPYGSDLYVRLSGTYKGNPAGRVIYYVVRDYKKLSYNDVLQSAIDKGLSTRHFEDAVLNFYVKNRINPYSILRPLGGSSSGVAERKAWDATREEVGGDAPSLLEAVRTLYSRGKEVASKLFGMKFFDVAQTPKFMQELGLRGDKFTIKYGVIARHIGKDNSHTLTARDWEQLPEALQNPFAISRLTDKEDSYRIYTTLQTAGGEYVVVGADVKNAGREIEVNAVSTVFGRRNNANLSKNEEVIYRSKEITPEQSSLLKRPNFAQYPTAQELSTSKDVPSAGKDTTKEPTANGLGVEKAVSSVQKQVEAAEAEVNTNPTEGQKVAGNYKKGHVQVGTFNITIEQPKGSVRSGVDKDGSDVTSLVNRGDYAKLGERVSEWEGRIGAKVRVIERAEDVDNVDARQAIERGLNVSGWYDVKTDKVGIYAPNVRDVGEVDRTIVHEVVSHKGLRGMLGEKSFDKLCDKTWDMMSEAERAEYESYPGVENIEDDVKRRRAAADEYISHLAEGVDLSDAERSTWRKVMDSIMGFLKKLYSDIKLTEKDLEEIIKTSYRKMRVERERGNNYRSYGAKKPDRANKGDSSMFRFIGERGAVALDRAEEANVRLDNLTVAREIERKFGEKKSRIEKLRSSKPIEIDFNNEYELNRDSAKQWLKDNIRGEYVNKDTGETISISKVGINEVTSHGTQDKAHLISLKAIPGFIEESIFIDEIENTKDNNKYDSYRYYVCGAKIGGEDYTVKIVVGVKGDNKYYDHRLIEIEKGSLIDNLNGLSNSVAENQRTSFDVKDSKLVSILQVNNKENAKRIKAATGWERGADGKWRYEVSDGKFDVRGELHPERRRLSKEEQSELDNAFDDLLNAYEKGSLAYDKEITKDTDMADIYVAGGMSRERAERLLSLEDKEKRLKRSKKHLDDYLDDESLYAAYPELREIEVVEGNPMRVFTGLLGGYNPQTKTLTLYDLSKDTLLHEVQHIIQHIEGFATGGSAKAVSEARRLNNKIQREVESLLNQLDINEWLSRGDIQDVILRNQKEGRYFNLGYAFSESLGEITGYALRQKLDEANRVIAENNRMIGGSSNLSPSEHYRRLGGEVEARNVSRRMGMSVEERRNSLAEDTEDVSRADQIFIMGGLDSSERADGADGDVLYRSDEKTEYEDIVRNIKPKYGLQVSGRSITIYETADLERVRMILDKDVYEKIESKYHEPNVLGCSLPKMGYAFIFTNKAPNVESTWWHENTHIIYESLELADKEECGLAALNWLQKQGESGKEHYSHATSKYEQSSWGEEGATRLVQYLIETYGAERFLNSTFDGNEKISKLANAIRNKFIYGKEEPTRSDILQRRRIATIYGISQANGGMDRGGRESSSSEGRVSLRSGRYGESAGVQRNAETQYGGGGEAERIEIREREGAGAYSDRAVTMASDPRLKAIGRPLYGEGKRMREYAARQRRMMAEQVGERYRKTYYLVYNFLDLTIKAENSVILQVDYLFKKWQIY